jgi:hypothetical protein
MGIFASEKFSDALPVCQSSFAWPRFLGGAKLCCLSVCVVDAA